jgi:hypothetical protein
LPIGLHPSDIPIITAALQRSCHSGTIANIYK